jgi:hypothetical protein
MAIINPFTGGSAALADIPVELQPQFQQSNRQQQMANLLLQQGMGGQPQGQMVSGHYVKPSWAQQLAPVANQALALYAGYQADKGQTDLAAALRNKQEKDITQFGELLKTDPSAAYSFASKSYVPQLREAGLKKMMPQEFDLAEGAKRYMTLPDGTVKEVAAGGEKLSTEYRDYLKAQKDPIKPFLGGFTDYQTMVNTSKAPKVSVNTANKFAGGFADKASGGAYDMYTAALNAPQQIENAKRTIELVNSGALTGPTANIGLEAAKILNVAGADNKDTIAKTELLFSNRGKAMLGAVKGSGLAGSAGLTEGERKFLTQAEGGSITLNAETLKAMAGLEIKLAVANQKKWNAQAGKMDKDILSVTGAGPVEVYTGIGTIDASNPLLAPKR